LRDEFRFLAQNKHHSSASLRDGHFAYAGEPVHRKCPPLREIKIIPLISNADFIYTHQRFAECIFWKKGFEFLASNIMIIPLNFQV